MANMRNSARRRARRAGRRRELHIRCHRKASHHGRRGGGHRAGRGDLFRIRTVEVQGNSIYSWEQVANASGISPGDNLFMLNREAVAGSIQAQLPYVQKVSVGRILPDTVVIQVEESQIAGLVEADVGGKWYINTEGRVLGSSIDNFTGQVVEMQGFTPGQSPDRRGGSGQRRPGGRHDRGAGDCGRHGGHRPHGEDHHHQRGKKPTTLSFSAASSIRFCSAVPMSFPINSVSPGRPGGAGSGAFWHHRPHL